MADTGSLIVVVEDDHRVRASLSALLRAAGHYETALGSAEELLAHGMPNGAVCLVADIRLPGLDGVALVEELRRRGDRTPVVMVTGHGDIPLAVRAVRAGASDFVEKPYDDEQLLASIGLAVADGVAETAAAQRIAQASTRVAALSAREREVLEALVAGKTTKLIAHELGLSVRTVEGHRGNLMARLGVRTLSAAMRIAFDAGWGR
jgi:two-component system, LuxR family, response regulator FixJ